MSLFKGFRTRAHEKFERELNAEESVAALAALALHPFVVGSPRPKSREVTKLVRDGSSKFAADVRNVKTADELRTLARSVVQQWHRAARHYAEEHYAREFGEALDATAREGETMGDVFGSDR